MSIRPWWSSARCCERDEWNKRIKGNYQKTDIMETLIRIVANGRTYDEQTDLVEQMYEMTEFAGVALTCLVVLAVMALA